MLVGSVRDPVRKMDQHVTVSLLRKSLRNSGLSELLLPFGVDASTLAQLEQLLAPPRVLDRREILFEQGRPFDSLYLVKKGLVKSEILTSDGALQVIAFHFPGELVGLDAFAAGTHPCSAVAVTKCELLRIPLRQLGELSREVPALAQELRRLMSREIAEEEQMLLVLGSLPAAQRVATFLVSRACRLSRENRARSKLTLDASRADIASYLGLRYETLRRQLAELEQLGIIHTLTRNSIEILDFAGLARAAGLHGGAFN
jgi:CRP/FNR family transcriptional regulator